MVTRMKVLRVQRGLTQRQIASSLGIHPSVISKVENGWLRPNSQLKTKIAESLGIPETELFEVFAKEAKK